MEHPRRPQTYRLPPELLERLESRARALGCSKTAFVQRALEAALGAPAVRAPVGAPVVSAESLVPVVAAVPVLSRTEAFRRASQRGRS